MPKGHLLKGLGLHMGRCLAYHLHGGMIAVGRTWIFVVVYCWSSLDLCGICMLSPRAISNLG